MTIVYTNYPQFLNQGYENWEKRIRKIHFDWIITGEVPIKSVVNTKPGIKIKLDIQTDITNLNICIGDGTGEWNE